MCVDSVCVCVGSVGERFIGCRGSKQIVKVCRHGEVSCLGIHQSKNKHQQKGTSLVCLATIHELVRQKRTYLIESRLSLNVVTICTSIM